MANLDLSLLRPDTRGNPESFLEVSLREISGHVFWDEPTISETPIFVTADFVWGPSENHPDNHRYILSAYLFDAESSRYYLQDRYMTTRRYDGNFGDDKTEVLMAEKAEILERLKRVKAEREREPKASR